MDMLQQLLDAALGTDTPIERVIIVGMSFWMLWRERHVNKIQEKRVEGAMKIADAAHTFSNALDRNTDALRTFILEDGE